MDEFTRFEAMIGHDAITKLKKSHVAVFGIGGVGGHAVDTLARSAIGKITIVDFDVIALTNLNRQLIATHSTIGQKKIDIMEKHIQDINPKCEIHSHDLFVNPETIETFDFDIYDYVLDCMDNVSAKLLVIQKAMQAQVNILSCMGTGNKFDPMKLEIKDIYETSYCPLARVMRRELKKRQITSLTVVTSSEKPVKAENTGEMQKGRQVPGSNAFVPNVAGILMAKKAIMDLSEMKNYE